MEITEEQIHKAVEGSNRDQKETSDKANAIRPNPGTPEAIEAGCKCPVMDNHYGRGPYEDGVNFWYTSNCPVHMEGVKDA